MALSKTHILVSALALHRQGLDSKLKEMIPLVILPDAIRCFNYGSGVKNNRVITHFEINPATGKASWMKFPSIKELKSLDDEKIQSLSMGIEPDYNQVAIGDETSIPAFCRHNIMLEELEYRGIIIHLHQDRIYDSYIREKIDCSRRSEGIFKFNGKVYDKKSVRKLITEFEEQEFRLLAEKYKKETGETPDENWFEENVKSAIDSAYCKKMAECTWKYISIDLETAIPEHLTNDECEAVVEKMISKTKMLV